MICELAMHNKDISAEGCDTTMKHQGTNVGYIKLT